MTALVIIIFNGDNSLFTYGNLVEGIETQHEKALEGREEEDE